MEENKRDIYGDNYLEDNHLNYWDTDKINRHRGIDASAVTYGAGLALTITFASLLLGFIWAQLVQSVTLNYSFLVDLALAGSVLFGSFKGSARARHSGLLHGALIGIAYSVLGVLILAVLLPINWFGALETILLAALLGSVGGIAGLNYRAGLDGRNWRNTYDERLTKFSSKYEDDYNDIIGRD
ncbi:MAG TPA: TIGR04086 family membrane protein [Verrucomicrobiae bacterium]|nr:TIGR04086 family membrane protein [Verrucomicrobiae bacterium]